MLHRSDGYSCLRKESDLSECASQNSLSSGKLQMHEPKDTLKESQLSPPPHDKPEFLQEETIYILDRNPQKG